MRIFSPRLQEAGVSLPLLAHCCFQAFILLPSQLFHRVHAAGQPAHCTPPEVITSVTSPHLTTGSTTSHSTSMLSTSLVTPTSLRQCIRYLGPQSLTSSPLPSTHLSLPPPDPEPGACCQQPCYLQSLFKPPNQ